MPAKRGSQHRLGIILETIYGTTPATPAMTELPITRLRKNKSMGAIRSAQIRSHPFLDRMLPGAKTQDLEIGAELQPGNHDVLLQMLAGQAWNANVLKIGDALLGATMESRSGPAPVLYDQFIGCFVNRFEITISADEESPVGVTFGFGALTSELDATTSLATTTPAAVDVDPYVYTQGLTELAGVARPVTSITFRAERTVDPLRVIGSRDPRENVPGDFTVTGSITTPFEDGVESGILEAFTTVPIHVRLGSTTFLDFLIPSVKYTSLGRSVEGRGALMQEIEFEALYNSTQGTILVITRSAP